MLCSVPAADLGEYRGLKLVSAEMIDICNRGRVMCQQGNFPAS